jgi:hypothetical protein
MKKDSNHNSLVKSTEKPKTSVSFEKRIPKVEMLPKDGESKPIKKKHTTGQKISMTVAVLTLGIALTPVFGTGIGVLILGFCVIIPKVWSDEW